MGKTTILQKLTNFEALKAYLKNHEDEFVTVAEDELGELQSCYISILKDIDSFFLENGIEYCISGGSLLGKVRHNGFIPWDDDVDITIMRDGLEKLKQIYKTSDHWFTKKYEFVAPGFGKNANNRIAKLYKNDSVMESVMSTSLSINKIFVDLFVTDYVPDNNFMMMIRGTTSIVLIGIISCVETKRNKGGSMEFELGVRWKLQRRLRLFLGTIFSVIPAYKWYGYLDRVTMNTRENRKSRRITFPTGRIYYFKEMMETDSYYPFQRAEFCGVDTWIPNKPEDYLTNRYGDWKTVPERKEREVHYYKRLKLGEY